MKMKIFLCDDNVETLAFYEEKLQELAAKHNRILEIQKFKSGEELLFHFEDSGDTIDAIYLDINMPGLDGVEVAEKLREQKYRGEIIFLTVSKKHFLPAFDVRAFNYIIKNQTTNKRFETIFLGIVNLAEDKDRESILLKASGARRKIEVDAIHYFEVRKRIVTIYYRDEQFEFFSTMEKLESELLGKGFFRVNRSYLVALNSVQSSTYDTLLLKNGHEVPIGRTYRKEVRQYLKDRMP